ncbi:hypothetical protein D3C72_1544940 [compost metagenome]
MIAPQSVSIGLDGMPSMAMPPPMIRVSTHCLKAMGEPDISSATSKPTFRPSSCMTSRRSSLVVFTVRTPGATFCASSRRKSLISVRTTVRAPAWRATAAAIMPMGPAPVTSTSSPSRSNCCAVCTALPNGSRIEPIS